MDPETYHCFSFFECMSTVQLKLVPVFQIVEVHYGIRLRNLTVDIAVEDPRSNASAACFHHENLSSRVTAAQYFKCDGATFGRKLTITVTADHKFRLRLCEVKVYSQSVLSPQDACGVVAKGKIESFEVFGLFELS